MWLGTRNDDCSMHPVNTLVLAWSLEYLIQRIFLAESLLIRLIPINVCYYSVNVRSIWLWTHEILLELETKRFFKSHWRANLPNQHAQLDLDCKWDNKDPGYLACPIFQSSSCIAYVDVDALQCCQCMVFWRYFVWPGRRKAFLWHFVWHFVWPDNDLYDLTT